MKKGEKSTPEMRKLWRKIKLGENNPNWKGDAVQRVALHRYVSCRLRKPKKCRRCNIATPVDLSNNGVYNRKLCNWEWLCRKCHIIKDGGIERLKKMGFKKGHINQSIVKLTKEKRDKIIILRKEKHLSHRKLAKIFNVSHRTIGDFLIGKTWK